MRKSRGFTLVELMITIGVMVVLMGIVFRLAGISGDGRRKATTVSRLHRLENCLSGYYAAFGSYPPVKLHASRDIFKKVNDFGEQNSNGTSQGNISNWGSNDAWMQVRAACRAQPIGCSFPHQPDSETEIANIQRTMQQRVQSGYYDRTIPNFKDSENAKKIAKIIMSGFSIAKPGMFGDKINAVDWGEGEGKVCLFQFGLLSYLLPRYMVMMNVDSGFLNFAQWQNNNSLPTNPYTGRRYNSWQQIMGDLGYSGSTGSSSTSDEKLTAVMNIRSQGVCARWMPNLAGMCGGGGNFFGVGTGDGMAQTSIDNPYWIQGAVHTPGGSATAGSNQYLLKSITISDGWGNEFYYYSPMPYQRYQLWSGGPNGKTFPPWIDLEKDSRLTSTAKAAISDWMADDVVQLSN